MVRKDPAKPVLSVARPIFQKIFNGIVSRLQPGAAGPMIAPGHDGEGAGGVYPGPMNPPASDDPAAPRPAVAGPAAMARARTLWTVAAMLLVFACSGPRGAVGPAVAPEDAAPAGPPAATEAPAPAPARDSGAAAVDQSGPPADGWREVVPGVRWLAFERDQPRPIRGVVARIDLSQPGLEIVTTPAAERDDAETLGLRTSTFVRRSGALVAVNAAPFAPVRAFENQPHTVVGWHIHDGRVVSPGAGQATLVFNRAGRADVVRLQAGADVADIRWAVSGFGEVIIDGEVAGDDGPLHPRTGAGVSRDGRTLWLMVVDGRQAGYSEGVTTAGLGRLLLEQGAWQGINLDGGGTTTMAVVDEETGARVLNRPIHGGIPGLERPSASHLGVRIAAGED